MKSFNMEVSKKEAVNGVQQYVKQGEIAIFYPLLADLGLDAKLAEKPEDEDGFPIYADPKAQYAFDAVLAAVKAQARNKLISGTATLKDGQKIAETVEELLEAGSANKGDALAAIREMLAAFKVWLPTTGKKTATQSAIYDLAANRKGLALQTADKKAKFQGYLSDFASTLTPVQVARFERPLVALNDACEATDALDDM